MNKSFMMVLSACVILFISASVLAQDESNSITITAKQGFVMTWEDATVKNLTTFETIRTKPVEGWGKWNAFVDGWLLDAGFAWDANTVDNGAVLLGRKFGTLGKYIPFLDFPLLNKVDITIYPLGIYINDLTHHPRIEGCSGGAIVRAEIKFG